MIQLEEIKAVKEATLGLEATLLSLLTLPGDYVVDVGASTGLLTTWLAKWSAPNGIVEAIEPDPARMRELIQAVKPWQHQVHCHTVAASNENKSGILYMRTEGVAYDSKINSLGLPDGGRLLIDIKRLDSILDRVPDVIKIDVEGAEELVLEGMGALLQTKSAIVFEYAPAASQYYLDLGHAPRVLTLLREKGFSLWVISKYADILYVLSEEQEPFFKDYSKKQWGGVENILAMSTEKFEQILRPVIEQKIIKLRTWLPSTFIKEQIRVNYGAKR